MRPASRGPSRLADNGMVRVSNALSRTGRWIWSVRRLMLLAGALLVLTFPDANLEFLAWFGLVPGLVLIVRSPTAREGGIRAWWLGAGYLIAALYWMAPEIGPAVLLGPWGGGWGCPPEASSAPRGPGRGRWPHSFWCRAAGWPPNGCAPGRRSAG